MDFEGKTLAVDRYGIDGGMFWPTLLDVYYGVFPLPYLATFPMDWICPGVRIPGLEFRAVPKRGRHPPNRLLLEHLHSLFVDRAFVQRFPCL
jgi:hypothetical protein